MTMEQLTEIARKTVNPRRLSDKADAGGVAAAIESDSGSVYTGVCIDTPSGMGFCAEHAAAAAMVTAGENRAVRMVAVYRDGTVVAPCGRCREFIRQLHDDNMDCEVGLRDKTVTLRSLLPEAWA